MPEPIDITQYERPFHREPAFVAPNELTLAVFQTMWEAHAPALDARFVGSARCTGCCPVANILSCVYGTVVYVNVEQTRIVDIGVLEHDERMQTLIRILDYFPKGKPITYEYMDVVITALLR